MIYSPDQIILFEWGWLRINATLAGTWVIMVLIVVFCRRITRNLTSNTTLSKGQNLVEVIVEAMGDHIREITLERPEPFLPFVGTLFIFILCSNLLSVVPFFIPPTGSLSTTTALALCVFVAVPVFGLSNQSLKSYLGQYLKPSPIMLPFNIMGEITRTFALAMRLYGNVMSGTVITFVLLIVTPLFFPVVMQGLGLLTGTIQAYIFSLLALVYIASALQNDKTKALKPKPKDRRTNHG
ncbi:AtpB1 [Desulforapulum autotrophicum HRM2]|uniref:ATP synthase subunit a n=1 Tax=Desulforapulum autotrophicum (strain ATCC 43914 / DSM 3382 / VKM B-1955 / HRM2) TaxID=177437 RepID=C0Q8V6_DESAH|nr:F0F1 ATP synthase subunit A [Desulforapulum autotrophicum]ACN14446.1 AtpB1 [Desulforapulum autotrophicum HRM2]